MKTKIAQIKAPTIGNERLAELKELAPHVSWQSEDWHLLNQALTHITYFEGAPQTVRLDNQRLEFLGDAVLSMVIGAWLFQKYPDCQEGDLSKMRAAVVCEAALAKSAKSIGLGRYLLLGKGGEKNGDRDRESILADTFEAVVGALYLSMGVDRAQEFIMTALAEDLEHLSFGAYEDYKSLLQQFVQSKSRNNITYRLLAAKGPDHQKHYQVGAFYNRKRVGVGEGGSKKAAEQKAAQAAWENKDSWQQLLNGK